MSALTWRRRVCASIVADNVAPPDPRWAGTVPHCNEQCPHYDGKRCRLLGQRPDTLCEPVVEAMGNEIARTS